MIQPPLEKAIPSVIFHCFMERTKANLKNNVDTKLLTTYQNVLVNYQNS